MRQFPDPQGLNQDSKAQLQELRFLHALMQAPNTTTSACSLAIFNSSSKRRESGQGERPRIPQLATQALCCVKLITSISIRTRTDQNNLLNMLRQKRSYQLVNAKQLQNSLSLSEHNPRCARHRICSACLICRLTLGDSSNTLAILLSDNVEHIISRITAMHKRFGQRKLSWLASS